MKLKKITRKFDILYKLIHDNIKQILLFLIEVIFLSVYCIEKVYKHENYIFIIFVDFFAFVSFADFLRQIIQLIAYLFKTELKLKYLHIKADRHLSKYKISEKEKKADFDLIYLKNIKDDNAVITSESINKLLINGKQIHVLINNKCEKRRYIKRILKEHRDKFNLAFRVKVKHLGGTYFFNEKKLCMSTDIIDDEVCCFKGSYFDSFLTNELCFKKIIDEERGKTICDFSFLNPIETRTNTFKSVCDSDLENHIGVSTLCISSDNRVLYWKQNLHADQSNGKVVPTGSGSCDWKDYKKGDTLNKTVIRAMERELSEEGLVDLRDTEVNTKLIGFFRWVSRGGKPEFIGITKVGISHKEFKANLEEVFGEEGSTVFISGKFSDISEFEKLIKELYKNKDKDEYSVPFAAILQCLTIHMCDEKTKNILDKFLFG